MIVYAEWGGGNVHDSVCGVGGGVGGNVHCVCVCVGGLGGGVCMYVMCTYIHVYVCVFVSSETPNNKEFADATSFSILFSQNRQVLLHTLVLVIDSVCSCT